MGPSERLVPLLTTEVTLDQTLGNWYHFIKPIHRIRIFFLVSWGEVRPSPLGTSATVWPIVPAPDGR
jgi:hypothetical protein